MRVVTMDEINVPKPLNFLDLPPEIRAVIYQCVFETNGARICVADSDTPWDEGETLGQLSRIVSSCEAVFVFLLRSANNSAKVRPPITSTVTLGNEPLLVCKQLYAEAGPAFRANAVLEVQEHMLLWDKKQTLRALVDLKAIQITSEYEQPVTATMVTFGPGQSHLVVQGDIFHPFVRDLDQLDSVLDRAWVEAEDSSNESNPIAVTSRREDNLNLWNTPYSEDFHLRVQKSLLEVVQGVKSVTTILWTKSMVLNLKSGRNPISPVVLVS